jgi:hypothetical protein
LAAWDLEDEYSEDEQADPSFPEICFCQICNEEFDSPETAQDHMAKTLHENFEMISSVKSFKEEFEFSFALFNKSKESDWLDHLKKEFCAIFDQ